MEAVLSVTGLAELLATARAPTLIDVRRRPAFDADPRLIPGAVWRSPDAVEAWAAALDRSRPVLVYCVHGREVGRNACEALRRLGFAAGVLDGGIEAWRTAGGAVVPAGAAVRS